MFGDDTEADAGRTAGRVQFLVGGTPHAEDDEEKRQSNNDMQHSEILF